MPKTERQYGLWDSPITPSSLSQEVRLESPRWDSDGQTLLWLEGRSGRGVLVAQSLAQEHSPRDLTSDKNVRAEVGYGGGDFTVRGGHAYFWQHKTARLHRQPIQTGPARPITSATGKASSPAASPDGRHVIYVHTDEDDIDRLAIVDTDGSHWPQILAGGNDFYMQPRFSHDGRRVAWIAWDHPNMPWDGTRLFVADVVDVKGLLPKLDNVQAVAGGDDAAIFQPEFTPDGRLLFVSDETGWGRLCLLDLASGERRWLTGEGCECATPAWLQDMRTYDVSHDGKYAVVAVNKDAHHQLSRVDLASGEMQPIEALAQYTMVSQIVCSPTDDRVAFVGSSATVPGRIVLGDLADGSSRVLARSSGETISQETLARCESISWESAGGDICHGLYYAPRSEQFKSSGRPPLVVLVHGGPTSQVMAGYSPATQFLATRGYAVLVVNYRGGTGYGREYMLKLRGNWGICDVEDSISGAKYLSDQGKINPDQTVIMGGSAGGFTVLQTMTEHPQAFAAGVCLFGVANQFHLASETHKFESRYLDTILGPLPEAAEIYRKRSPVLFADKICHPLAVFQGAEDRVVPQAQSDMIVDVLAKNRVPHVYHVYEGEGHGWRKADTIEHYYTSLEKFLREQVIFR